MDLSSGSEREQSGIKAREIPEFPAPPDDQARFFGEPGNMVRIFMNDGSLYGFNVACPGCGQFGVVTLDPSITHWNVIGGSICNVATLSLVPSILKHCCGWHGYLKNGVFESC